MQTVNHLSWRSKFRRLKSAGLQGVKRVSPFAAPAPPHAPRAQLFTLPQPSRAARLIRLMAILLWVTWLAASSCPGSEVIVHTLKSEYQRGEGRILVQLPDDYTPQQHYRVLYVLPTSTSPELAALLRLQPQNRYQLIVVQMVFEEEPWYGDHATDPAMRQASYIRNAVVPLIEKTYSTVSGAEGRLLLGFSKSGWGAFSLILANPDDFGYAAAWDAPMMLDSFHYGMAAVFGTQAQLNRFRPDLLAVKQAGAFRDRTRLVLAGENKWGRLIPPPTGASHTAELHALFDRLGIRHVYRNDLPAPHRWDAAWLAPVLEELMQLCPTSRVLRGQTPAPSGTKPLIRPQIRLGGEVGAAAAANLARFGAAPFQSLPWLRADLTGETVSEWDTLDKRDGSNVMFRPFKNYSGDISGRFLEIMSCLARESQDPHPLLRPLLEELPKQIRSGGYFCASGEIDWMQPIDRDGKGASRVMLPALWGNARMLCGLVAACRAFPDNQTLSATARKLGDFYVRVTPRFTDPARMAEYAGGTTYASGYVTCWFPAMEGLVKLATLSGEKKYLETAATIAAFYSAVDTLPVDHAHGMLCNQVALLLLYEATGDAAYLARVEGRWDDLVRGGYINAAGGILERCRTTFDRDEGCAEADWLRLNLELGRLTGKNRYRDMAERLLHNHFLQNQAATGGFGHRTILCDRKGVYGFDAKIREATWCCDYHGQIGFINLRAHLLEDGKDGVTSHYALDFTCEESAGKIISSVSSGIASGEVLRQRLRLENRPPGILRVRLPGWANAVKAINARSDALPLIARDGYFATCQPVTDAEFIFTGGVYVEDDRCSRLPAGPVAGKPVVFGFGPKILATRGPEITLPPWPASLATLQAMGLEPFSPALRNQRCRFVFNRPVKQEAK